jgi:cell division septation protein DedD
MAPERIVPDSSPEEEFELVVGRRQLAAITFLALVALAVCGGASYLAGKALSARDESAQPVIRLEAANAPLPAPGTDPLPATPPVSPSVPTIEATILRLPAASARKSAEAPLFANPNPQAIYIQVGAVEKGVATVIAEGLRQHALDSFVSAGPTGKTFRVLIGPFPDAEAYQKARNIVDQIGLASFARRYQAE